MALADFLHFLLRVIAVILQRNQLVRSFTQRAARFFAKGRKDNVQAEDAKA